MIIYQQYEKQYYSDIKKITLESFELTSFNTDPFLPKNTGGKVAWELWCKPVLTSDKSRLCIIAVLDNKAVGYIIYGAEAGYSKILEKKIGTIILLAVKKEYRTKYKIAKKLIQYVLNIMKKHQFDIVSVGTDMDNLPALISYIHQGFIPILSWSTYRAYLKKIKLQNLFEISSIEPTNIKMISKFIKQLNRPISLLLDKTINDDKKISLNRFVKEKIRDNIQKSRINLYAVKNGHNTIAFFTIEKKDDITKITDKIFWRINDIIFLNKQEDENIDAVKSIFSYFHNEVDILEIFVSMNDWSKIRYLIQGGFIPVHNAITLHKYLK